MRATSEDARDRPGAALHRVVPALFVLLLGGAVSAFLFAEQRERERERIQTDFERTADDLVIPLFTRIDGNLEVLHSIGRFYAGSKSVEADEFAAFAAPTFPSRPGLKALAWVPRVAAAELAEHVSQAEERFHLPPGYQLRTPDGRDFVGPPGPGAGDSFPIHYVEPFEQRRALWGLELGSNADLRAAMEAARDEAVARAASPPTLGAGAAEPLGHFVFLPIYRNDAPHRTVAERRQNLAGFALAVLDLDASLEAARADADLSGIEFQLQEVTEGSPLFYPAAAHRWASGRLELWTHLFERAGRTWRVVGTPREGYLTEHRGWQAWSILAVGGLSTLILAAYLNSLSGRTARIEALISERTLALIGANRRLQGEMVERQRTQEEAQRAKGSAEESERRSRRIIETAHDAFVSMDAGGAITDWNHQAEVTFGWSREEVIGRPLAETIVPPRHREAHRLGLQRFVATGEGPVLNQRIELSALHRDGREFEVEITIAPLPSGESHLFCAFVHDISARKRAEEELRRAKDEAQEAARAKSDFLANMSHEIRTPLNAVIGMTNLALETELTPEQQEYLGLTKISADHLLAVIDDLLDFSKIEAGKFDLEMLDFDLREVLDDTLATLAQRAHQKGLELLEEVATDVPDAIRGDPHRLRQVVVNLVGNALKFTERGEVVLGVALDGSTPQDPESEGPVLHFSVRDTGIGISPEQQERLFQAFSQADASTTRKYGGTGLGLVICARIVQMMGGRVWLESEAGRGSTFHFTARFGSAHGAVTRASRREPPSLRDLPVLVVDDNLTNLRILEEMLSKWGMRPTLAEDGHAALAALDQASAAGRPFPLVLLDAMMPDMDGFTLAERILQRPDARPTLMMLSSAGRREDADRSRRLGIATYLTRPVRRSTLLAAILTVLGDAESTAGRGGRAEPAAVGAGQRKLRVLLAEDNAINQRLAVTVLEKRGHEVVVVGDGRKALRALEQRSFDAVLMDVQMPEMDGFEATAAIRARERACGVHVPIIAMTAHAMPGDRERCLAAGMDGYLRKPLDPNELFRVLEALPWAGASASLEASPGAAAALDRSAALARVGGDEKLLAELATLLLDECPRQLAAIRAGITARDAGTVERSAHTLSSAVGVFGAASACEAAQRLETIGRDAAWVGAEEAWTCLDDAVRRLQTALREIVPTAVG